MTDNSLFSRERQAGYDPHRMGRSVALIVGAGALGQNTAINLALSGVGELRLVDFDLFEEHNRTRSPAYPFPEEQARYGLSKVRVVAHKLARLMTADRPVVRWAHAWIQELGDGAFQGVTVLLSCVDSPAARAYLADKARLHNIPLIEGGFEGADITLSCYPAGTREEAITAPCWRCSHQQTEGVFSCRFYARQAEKAGFIPAIQNAAATLGGLQAEAAVLAIHGSMPLASSALDMNIRTGRSRLIQLATDPHCPGIHATLPGVPVRLNTQARDTVADLLRELTDQVGANPMLLLNEPLVWTAPCTVTGRLAEVRSPRWRWALNPRCIDAGGPFRALGEAPVIDSPLVFDELCSQASPEVLSATCREVGYAPLSLVVASAGDTVPRYFSLPGEIEELFEIANPQESATEPFDGVHTCQLTT